MFYTKWRHLVKDNNSIFSYWKQTFLSVLASWLQSKHYEKSIAQTSFFHLKMFDAYASVVQLQITHSRRRRRSLMPDACEIFCHASPNVTSLSVCCHSKRPWTASIFPSFDDRCCRFYLATPPVWFCSTSFVKVPVAVVENEICWLSPGCNTLCNKFD